MPDPRNFPNTDHYASIYGDDFYRVVAEEKWPEFNAICESIEKTPEFAALLERENLRSPFCPNRGAE